jgi:hypothetical protein
VIDSAQATLPRQTGPDPTQPLSTGADFSGRSSYGGFGGFTGVMLTGMLVAQAAMRSRHVQVG